MSGDTVAIRATVRGRVQGVGFRDYVQTRARALRLTGYVQNGDDGRSVEVLAEGDREALQRLLRNLHEGPRMALVDAVDVQWIEPAGEHTAFRVRY
jgi:acylphosphatase